MTGVQTCALPICFPVTIGWGLDFYTGCITEQNGWKTVVDDTHTICHLNSQTFAQNKIDIGVSEFCRNAETICLITF